MNLTQKQKIDVLLAISMQQQKQALEIQLATIRRELGYEGVNLGEAMDEIKKELIEEATP